MSKTLKLFLVSAILVSIIGLAGYSLRPVAVDPDPRPYLGTFFSSDYDLSPEYASLTKKSQYISLADGTRLAADVFLPEDPLSARASSNTAFPTILEYTPYNRAVAQPGMSWWERIYLWWSMDLDEPVYDRAQSLSVRHFVSRGYAYISVDMRGTGASFGSQAPLMPQMGVDGAEVVGWIALQTWSDGTVGMRGQSYLGWSQIATASHAPDALKCISPEFILFDTYSEGVRPGGITATRWLDEYSDYLQSFNLSRMDIDGGFLPAAPVLDEDGDGQILDEIPLAGTGDSTLFTDDGPPQYRDGQQRSGNVYYSAVMEHRNNTLIERFTQDDVRYSDDALNFYGGGVRFQDTSPGAMLDKLVDRQMPVFHIGGWFDGFLTGTTKLYSSMQDKAPARMMIGPRFHIPQDVTQAYKDFLGYSGNVAAEQVVEQNRFFDWCVRGQDNGFEQEPPVTIYVMHKGWRTEPEWPLARQQVTSFHLTPDQVLSNTVGEMGEDVFALNFNHQSNYGTNNSNRWIMMDGPDELMLRNEADEHAFVYETVPLEQGVEVTGHPRVHIWVSANQSDTDLFVYLSDVDADGQVHYVTEGKLRASFHTIVDSGEQTLGRLDVRPELIWHGYKAGDQVQAPLANENVVELAFELMPTAWFFRPGHKIRISITGADVGNFELNPTLCPENKLAGCAETSLTIHRGPARPSRIDLPVIPTTAP